MKYELRENERMFHGEKDCIINPNDYPVDVYLTMGNYLRHLRVIDAKIR